MDNFIELSLKEIGNIDDILSGSANPNIQKIAKKTIEKQHRDLVSKIDAILKQDTELNDKINELVKMRKILTYDFKEYFTKETYHYDGYEDISTGSVFMQEEYDYATNLVQNWPAKKNALEEKLAKLESSRLKFLNGGKIQKCKDRLKFGESDYERYTKLFDEKKKMDAVDKVALEKEFKEKLTTVKGIIGKVINSQVLDAIKQNPSLVTYDVFIGTSYPAISTSENSNENNKHLYRYFDSRDINKKLSSILKAYNKEKEKKFSELISSEPGME